MIHRDPHDHTIPGTRSILRSLVLVITVLLLLITGCARTHNDSALSPTPGEPIPTTTPQPSVDVLTLPTVALPDAATPTLSLADRVQTSNEEESRYIQTIQEHSDGLLPRLNTLTTLLKFPYAAESEETWRAQITEATRQLQDYIATYSVQPPASLEPVHRTYLRGLGEMAEVAAELGQSSARYGTVDFAWAYQSLIKSRDVVDQARTNIVLPPLQTMPLIEPDKVLLSHTEQSFISDVTSTVIIAKDAEVGAVALFETGSGNQIARVEQDQDGSFYHAVIDPSLRYLATANYDATVFIWDIASSQEVARLQQDGVVRAITFSGDGQFVATAGGDSLDGIKDHSARVWETATGRELIRVFHESSVSDAVLSPDGQILATIGGETSTETGRIVSDPTLRLWNVTDGTAIGQVTLENFFSGGKVVFSSDGRLLATASSNSAQIWNVADLSETITLDHGPDVIHSLRFSPDGRSIATMSRVSARQVQDYNVRVWDVEFGSVILGMARDAMHVAFDSNSSRVAIAGLDNIVYIYDITSPRPIKQLPLPDTVTALSFLSNGEQILVAGTQGVRSWDLSDLPPVDLSPQLAQPGGVSVPTASLAAEAGVDPQIVIASDDIIAAVVWSPDGTILAGASRNGTVSLWDRATGQPLQTFSGFTDDVTGVAWSPDGSLIAAAAQDGILKIWDRAGAERMTIQNDPSYTSFACVAWSPDGTQIATCDTEGYYHPSLIGSAQVKIWDAVTGELQTTLSGHTRNISSVSWSPDSTRLASASDDGTVMIWLSQGGAARTSLKGHGNQVRTVAWSPDGQYIASGDWVLFPDYGTGEVDIRIWDVFDGTEVASFLDYTKGVMSVGWSPDSLVLTSAHSDGTIKFWDIQTGKLIRSFNTDSGSVQSVAWSPDGMLLASAGIDGTIQLWDVSVIRTP